MWASVVAAPTQIPSEAKASFRAIPGVDIVSVNASFRTSCSFPIGRSSLSWSLDKGGDIVNGVSSSAGVQAPSRAPGGTGPPASSEYPVRKIPGNANAAAPPSPVVPSQGRHRRRGPPIASPRRLTLTAVAGGGGSAPGCTLYRTQIDAYGTVTD